MPGRIVLALGAWVLVAGVLRFFVRGWLEPLGVPVVVGSSLASVTVVLFVAIILLFSREGRAAGGRYLRAAAWYCVLAAWAEMLVIAGILTTEWTGARTYYQGPWAMVEHWFPTATAHAIGHTQGFLVRLIVELILGAIVYAIARRRRPAA